VIALHARAASVALIQPLRQAVWLLVDEYTTTHECCSRAFVVGENGFAREGYGLYIVRPGGVTPRQAGNVIELPEQLEHLGAGDILSISPQGERLRVAWRQNSRQNSILLTERCDHYCLMCSQPPKLRDDDWLLEQAFDVVGLLPPSTTDIGFTGGEPTLYGDRLLALLRLCRDRLPGAAVHVLSNGRRFNDPSFANSWAAIDNPNMMVGIPLYGAEPALHDYVVQSRGAFNATVSGILNLAKLRQPTEIRVVIHKQTAPHLVEIAEYISRNLPFVDQVALMGLEMTGLARANIQEVWIDPIAYREELAEAVFLLDRKRIKVMVYNHQLCLVDPRIWPYTVRSISDWKNEFHEECGSCDVRQACGGFFFSAKHRFSDHIRAIRTRGGEAEPTDAVCFSAP
jgi:His-Xaa-Ser system radical SAM maturase HxsC